MPRSDLILRGAPALAGAAALVAGPSALAQTNPGFEAGLSGWTTLGDLSTRPRRGLLPEGGASAAVAIDGLAVTPVPGPAAALLPAAGLALTGAISRRRRRA